MKLTAENVHRIFQDCLFKEGEDMTEFVPAKSVTIEAGFHPARLAKNKESINAMLDELPDEFKQSGGGGWTFLNMCQTKDGEQWADLHRTMDLLLCLGIATGHAEITMPREMWHLFGGVPYLVIHS